MYFDLHNHLRPWSPDATQSFTELWQRNQAGHLYGFGISDHYDIGSLSARGREWIFDSDQYLRTYSPYRKSWSEARAQDVPAFVIGIELGYQPQYTDRLNVLAAKAFDYTILSVHTLDGQDPASQAETVYRPGLIPVYRRYLEVLEEAVAAIPEASILAHFDYISRYTKTRQSKLYYQQVSDQLDSLFRQIIGRGIPLEINTGTIAALRRKGYDLKDAMPDPAIVNRYRELGGELFTLATDSHCADHHLRYIPETLAWLAAQGIKRLCYFEQKTLHTYPLEG